MSARAIVTDPKAPSWQSGVGAAESLGPALPGSLKPRPLLEGWDGPNKKLEELFRRYEVALPLPFEWHSGGFNK